MGTADPPTSPNSSAPLFQFFGWSVTWWNLTLSSSSFDTPGWFAFSWIT